MWPIVLCVYLAAQGCSHVRGAGGPRGAAAAEGAPLAQLPVAADGQQVLQAGLPAQPRQRVAHRRAADPIRQVPRE